MDVGPATSGDVSRSHRVVYIDCDVKVDPMKLVSLLQLRLQGVLDADIITDDVIASCMDRFQLIHAPTLTHLLNALCSLPRILQKLGSGEIGGQRDVEPGNPPRFSRRANAPQCVLLVDAPFSFAPLFKAIPYPSMTGHHVKWPWFAWTRLLVSTLDRIALDCSVPVVVTRTVGIQVNRDGDGVGGGGGGGGNNQWEHMENLP